METLALIADIKKGTIYKVPSAGNDRKINASDITMSEADAGLI